MDALIRAIILTRAKNSYEDSVKRLDRFEGKLTLAAPAAGVIPSPDASIGVNSGEGSRTNVRSVAPQKIEQGGSVALPPLKD